MTGHSVHDAVVVGAGITGLACAHALRQAGLRVQVLEREDRPGGCIETVREDGYLLECGPHTLRAANTELVGHLHDIGLGDRIRPLGPVASRRYIVRGGRLAALPSSPLGFFGAPFLSAGAKIRLLREPWIAPHEESDPSLGDFVARRFGPEVRDGPLDAFAGGIWAGDPARISARAVFPELVDGVRDHGNVLRWARARRKSRRADGTTGSGARRGDGPRKRLGIFTLEGGLATWPNRLGELLGEALHTGVEVDELRRDGDAWVVEWRGTDGASRDGGRGQTRARHLILTGGPGATARLAGDVLRPDAHDALESMRSASLAIVHLGFRISDVEPPEAFGVLVPEREGRACLGILFVSSALPGRAPGGAVTTTTFVGGIRHPERLDASDEELVALATTEHEALLGFEAKPIFARVRRWNGAIPQYEIGHAGRVEALERQEVEEPTLHLRGRARGGVSVPDCWLRGTSCAERIVTAWSKGTVSA